MEAARRGDRRRTRDRPAPPEKASTFSRKRRPEMLRQTDLFGLQTFRPALHNKRHPRAFIQRAVPARLDGGKMDENVFAILALDKTKSLGRVEPLHRTGFFHVSFFLLMRSTSRTDRNDERHSGRTCFEVRSNRFNCVQGL